MATKLDPHHLVALMCYAFKDKQDGSPRRLDPSLHSLKGDIVDNYRTNVRTFPILDAVAHISISRKESQVVAIGLQLNSRKQEIRLTVAENQKVTDGLVNHLNQIWRKLQALSSEYERNRGGRWDRSQPRSPEMSKEVGLSLKMGILRDIYQYSLEKQMKRIDKWAKGLRRFMKELLKRRIFHHLQGFELSLYKAVVALSLAAEVVSKLHDNPKDQLTESEWELVYFQSILANEHVRIVLADRKEFGCELLAQELGDHLSQDPFQLRRALEKLTSLPRHIETLFRFAYSPRLRPALRYRLFISAVPKNAHTVKLPTSPQEWKSFLEVACYKHYDFQETHAVELAERFGSSKWVCPVHCECGLIQYLQTRQGNQWDCVPPFSYIGVSKLSCSACRIWIETFNEQSGRKFYTRGSHGRWYWPWGIPIAEGPLVGVMAPKVLDEYLAYLESQKLLRSNSDSSGASSDGAEHGLSDDHRKDAEAVGAAIVQEYGDSGLGFFDDE
ncbi:hypothetical protein L873DRAFT_1798836 [Choiromyces venosus 120613-1]|uniref:Uncharacterized protein n=1 Tax=Choiromyces venosus 120613-1 TaxID=1336337 RepID=A0A3N4K929_9PEZI|nr:hypothetical protein L873DRAFT_1798836 [Choiromyces venosus 120613-1]